MVQLAPFRHRCAGQKVANCTMPLSNALGKISSKIRTRISVLFALLGQ
jgi:hypothetical protein